MNAIFKSKKVRRTDLGSIDIRYYEQKAREERSRMVCTIVHALRKYLCAIMVKSMGMIRRLNGARLHERRWS